jgi:hypothetical protein
MICPECKAEYRAGFTKCADCEVELVDKISAENERSFALENIIFKTVMTSFNQGEIALAKSLLESNNVQCFVQGESFNSLLKTSIPVSIKVPEDSIEQAKEILKEFL